MAQYQLYVFENEDIIAKVKKFLKDESGCSYRRKESQCCHQFSEEAVLSNVNKCLELSCGELKLVLANIQGLDFRIPGPQNI